MSHYVWNHRILIVDDEQEIAMGYKEILCPQHAPRVFSSRSPITTNKDKFHFQVDIAFSVEEALSLVKKSVVEGSPYAMGFFDVLLGANKDGIELVKEVFELDARIYAVFVTAYHDRSVDSIRNYLGEKSLERWDYLNKPLNDGELLQKARNFCALWNLRLEKDLKEEELNNLRRHLFDADRASSVAAISRSVTHEFGNILMQIMGKADISRKKNPEDMRKALDVILEASQRATKILDRFKMTSSPNFKQEKKSTYLHEILDKCLELMEFQIKNTHTTIHKLRMDCVKAPLNQTTFMQVLLNVFINSIQAMGDGGQIKLELIKNEDTFELIIIDTGPGVGEEIFDSVMVPFFTTKGSKGTGLGLAICKEIIEVEHAGDLLLQNIKPNGLKVTLRLPLVDYLEEK